MVQLFYYEQVGRRCVRLLQSGSGSGSGSASGRGSSGQDRQPVKVLLHAEEGGGCVGPSAYWLLRFPWFTRRLCRVTEVSGGQKRRAGWATVSHSEDGGCVSIACRLKPKKAKQQQPQSLSVGGSCNFLLRLTSSVSDADFHRGYSLTGWLEAGRGRQRQATHLAMVKRPGY